MLIHDPYYDVQGVSNSSLRHINPKQDGSPVLFKQHWDGLAPSLKTSSLEFGNLVHLAVLEPHLCNYVIDDTNTPPKIREIVKDLYQSVLSSVELAQAITGDEDGVGPMENHLYGLLAACNRHSYGNTWKDETRMNKVMSGGSAYWDLLRGSDKFVITRDQFNNLEACMDSLKNTSATITEMLFRQQDDLEASYFNELEVHWTDPLYSFPLKSKIDRLHLDHQRKEFSIIDLKTTGKNLGLFPESFKTYHYARQIAFYEQAAFHWIYKKYGTHYMPGDHCICAVESRGSNRAGLFHMHVSTVEDGKYEMEDLLQRLDYHFTHNSWVNEMELETQTKIYL